MTSIEDRWLRLEPIKVGWRGMEWARFEREIRMAFDEGIERGVLDRRYEFIFENDAGLPQGTAKGGVDAFRRLVDAGCIVVVGANYTDSAMALTEHANAAKVPLVSMCGTDAFHGEYCFRMGNGDVGDEPALIVNWLRRNGHRRVAVVSPASPIGEEYFRFLRQECRRRDPPRIMTTAFMQYIWGFDQLEGWVGIDQWCPENPRMHTFHERFVDRYGEDPWMWPNAIPGLAYDMAAVVVEAVHRARVLTGWGIKEGIERIRFMPAVTGGPNTHIAGGPYDHQLFKGDWLHYGRVRGGRLEFAGLYEPADDY
jgi:hypothetical protein